MGKYLWLAVTPDEYELPLAVADTARELGNMVGINGDTVIDAVLKQRDGSLSGRKFVKVRNDA